MIPYTYNIKDKYKGDTFKEVTFYNLSINDVIQDLTGATAKCKFRKNSDKGSVIRDMTEISGLTINVAENSITIDEFINDLPVGVIYYDVEVTLESGRVITFIRGKFNNIQDIS